MPKHPIRVVAKKTGLSAGLIRIWERRHGAVTPVRTETNRRLYTDEDIERLILLGRATQSGESISQIARLSKDELIKLLSAGGHIEPKESSADRVDLTIKSASEYLELCFKAVRDLDPGLIEATLLKASVGLTQRALFEQVLGPLMYSVGDLWREGDLKVVHEHLASAVVRTFLGNMSGGYAAHESAPRIIVTTPVGQLHEFGALMAGLTAASAGWKTIYLGPNIPAGDIASAVLHNNARVVALSLIYPADDPRMGNELEQLHTILGGKAQIIVGGRSAEGYRNVIDKIGALLVKDLSSLQFRLDSIRSVNAA
ncbi:MAG: MerR family transcriptional regulator [Candidatus Zixiibacteriota bacterium]